MNRAICALLTTGAGLLVGSLAAGGPANASQTICQGLSKVAVGSALGLKVSGETTSVQGNVTVCWYKIGANAHAASVRVQTHDNAAGFASDRKLSKTYGENPKTDTHFLPNPAFSTSLGAPAYGVTYSVTVLKSTTEVQVSAAGSTLAKVEALTHRVLVLV